MNPPKVAAVPNADALVYVNEDGSVRELTEAERSYVETEFSPLDGARPYIKSSYRLLRAEVPESAFIHPAPPPTATEPQTVQAVADSLAELMRKHGRS